MMYNLNWTIAFPKANFPHQLTYENQFFLIGSCFTEHIGKFLKNLKFRVYQNPAGILFDPHSIAFHLSEWAKSQIPREYELFFYNELWYHWKYHSQFSSTKKEKCYEEIQNSALEAINQLKTCDWIIITLGSSFAYQLSAEASPEHIKQFGQGFSVANCHKCPNQWFHKYLMPSSETFDLLNQAFHEIKMLNPKVQFLLNISPVRHLRDGVVENNRSKARLIEAVHQLVETHSDCYYLPSYEIVIDVLRDYRFFDTDKAHPNYEATQWVLQYFIENYFSPSTQVQIQKVTEILNAYQHRPKNPDTLAHQKFLKTFYEKTLEIQKLLPHLNWHDEIQYFGSIR